MGERDRGRGCKAAAQAQGEWTGRSLGGDGEETLASGERYTARRSECGRGSLGDVERASEWATMVNLNGESEMQSPSFPEHPWESLAPPRLLSKNTGARPTRSLCPFPSPATSTRT